MKKLLKKLVYIILTLVLIVVIATVIFLNTAPQIGAKAEGDRLMRMKESVNYNGERFVNSVKTSMDMSVSDMATSIYEVLKGGKGREPRDTIPTENFSVANVGGIKDSSIRFTWFGHSSFLIQINGTNILIDPVFSERASMFNFAGPKRFPYSSYQNIDSLPQIDAVLISHDHYDHLDYKTMIKLAEKVNKFHVPLGVGAHLEKWGVQPEDIQEFDWWQEGKILSNIDIAFTPSRHFSGRGLTDRFSTLWGSWVIISNGKRIFFSGDSGYFPGFKKIGSKYGPFDITMMECGQYNEMWSEIHMMPEETVKAHKEVQGNIMVPIHWGKFNLALHTWKDPVNRAGEAAKSEGVKMYVPVIGNTFSLKDITVSETGWWKNLQ